MAIGCEDVSARMMDLLYGEIPADELALLESHVAGCARCSGELATLRGTRTAARRALDADAPPARAHQAILRAAAAAAAAKEAQPIAARPAAERPSFWHRLRSRWTLPTFATVGAVAVVVLASKVFLEPEKTVELGRQTVHPAPAETPAAGPQAETQGTANALPPAEKRALGNEDLPPAEQPPAADKPLARATGAAPQERKRTAPKAGPEQRGLAESAAASRHHAAKGDLDSLLDGSEGASPAPRPSKREFAPPPPARAEAPSSPAPAGAAGRDDIVDNLMGNVGPTPGRAGGGRLQGGAGAAPPPVRAAAKAKKAAVPDDDLAPAPAASSSAPAAAAAPAPPAAPLAAAREEEKKSRRADAKTQAKPASESPVARADRLYAEGQWAEAARAYRELLRQDPRNADAPRWRQRLATAEAALAPQAPPAASAPAP